MAHRDIIVIGASAGGVELLLDLAAELPARLPASIFVVLHTPPGFLSTLPELLGNRGPLPAVHPNHGDEIAPAASTSRRRTTTCWSALATWRWCGGQRRTGTGWRWTRDQLLLGTPRLHEPAGVDPTQEP